MEAVSKGAHEGGGHVVGVTVPDLFPDRSGANGYVAEEVKTSSLAERIDHLTDLSAGSIVLPGSIGTLAELGVAWNLAFVARYSGSIPKPVVTVGESWSRIVADLIGVLETDPRLVMPVQTVEQAVAVIADRVPLDA
jgi:predicted Rossmann-fold nucleotide-binding protein